MCKFANKKLSLIKNPREGATPARLSRGSVKSKYFVVPFWGRSSVEKNLELLAVTLKKK